MDFILLLRSELNAFWNEAGITYDEYCSGVHTRGKDVPKVAEWEERLMSFPSSSTFYNACVQYCASGLESELKVLIEAISIDNEAEEFIRGLWGMNCRRNELLPRLMFDNSRNVRLQCVWLLRDNDEEWALDKLREMRRFESDLVVIDQLDGIIAFKEDPEGFD